MHPTSPRALLGAAATLPAAPARRGPAVPGGVMHGHIGRLPRTRVRVGVVAA